jgi:hypothetical protein
LNVHVTVRNRPRKRNTQFCSEAKEVHTGRRTPFFFFFFFKETHFFANNEHETYFVCTMNIMDYWFTLRRAYRVRYISISLHIFKYRYVLGRSQINLLYPINVGSLCFPVMLQAFPIYSIIFSLR